MWLKGFVMNIKTSLLLLPLRKFEGLGALCQKQDKEQNIYFCLKITTRLPT